MVLLLFRGTLIAANVFIFIKLSNALHLERNNPCISAHWELSSWKAALQRRTWGPLGGEDTLKTVCLCSHRPLRLQQAEHGQQFEAGGPPPPSSCGECPVPSIPVQERHKLTGSSSSKSHEDDRRLGVCKGSYKTLHHQRKLWVFYLCELLCD